MKLQSHPLTVMTTKWKLLLGRSPKGQSFGDGHSCYQIGAGCIFRPGNDRGWEKPMLLKKILIVWKEEIILLIWWMDGKIVKREVYMVAWLWKYQNSQLFLAWRNLLECAQLQTILLRLPTMLWWKSVSNLQSWTTKALQIIILARSASRAKFSSDSCSDWWNESKNTPPKTFPWCF